MRTPGSVHLSIGAHDSPLGYVRVVAIEYQLMTADEADAMADDIRACARRAREEEERMNGGAPATRAELEAGLRLALDELRDLGHDDEDLRKLLPADIR